MAGLPGLGRLLRSVEKILTDYQYSGYWLTVGLLGLGAALLTSAFVVF